MKMGKKKRNSIFGIGTTNSHRSDTTRGDSAREEKRKGKLKSHNDNTSKSSSKKSTSSKQSSKSSKSKKTYDCFKTFDDESKKHH